MTGKAASQPVLPSEGVAGYTLSLSLSRARERAQSLKRLVFMMELLTDYVFSGAQLPKSKKLTTRLISASHPRGTCEGTLSRSRVTSLCPPLLS